MELKWHLRGFSTSLTSTYSILSKDYLCEEMKIRNTRVAYARHICNSSTSILARKNYHQKFHQRFSLVEFILIIFLQKLFFTAVILLCSVTDHWKMRCAIPVDNLKRLIYFLSEKFVVLKDDITLCCCKTVFKERKGHYAQTAERQRTRKGPY